MNIIAAVLLAWAVFGITPVAICLLTKRPIGALLWVLIYAANPVISGWWSL